MEEPPSYDDVLQASQANVAAMASPSSETADTHVTITDPAKQGATGRKHVSYKVTTRTSNAKYKASGGSDSIVLRRYSEFHSLYAKLRNEFPGVVVPPCPEKNLQEKYRLSSEFIETRRQALEVFINKVVCHRLLKHSDSLRQFLEADETQWTPQQAFALKNEDEGVGLVGKMLQLGTDLVYNTKNLASSADTDKGEDTEYLQYKEYATNLDQHLKDAWTKSADFVGRQQAYAEALSSFGEAADSMSKFETGPAATAFTELTSTTQAVARLSTDHSTHIARVFAAPMKEQHRGMKSLKDTMADRSAALLHRTQASGHADQTKNTLLRLRNNPGVKPEAITTAEQKLADAQAALRKAEDEYAAIQERMKEELVVFQNQRSCEMARTLRDFALAQGKLAKESCAHWKALMAKMAPVVEAQSQGGAEVH